ncbi:MAG TPA: anti-sigma factor [Pyrinomonadaceae bacterium]|nr:anti-sigma factor [Pyrinomonadaceae bacterium]
MTDQEKELLYDLLVKKVTCGLDEQEESQLAGFDSELVEAELRSLELAATAVSMAALEIEPMPEHLFARVLEDSPAGAGAEAASEKAAPVFVGEDVWGSKRRRPLLSWLGWGVAAVLAFALGLDLYHDRFEPKPEQAKTVDQPALRPLTPAEEREQLLRTAPDVISATWAPGNVKDMPVAGDIVWSDSKQQGFMRFRNLPVNDAASTCYQLWIFDQTQDKATPIDGGIFDVASNGEVIIPIKAALTAVKPEMFALTIERHGGVVVSKREKIAALAKVETHSS